MHSARRNGMVLARFGYVRRVDSRHYQVSSPKAKVVRDVRRVNRNKIVCSCHYGRTNPCVHVHALRYYRTMERREMKGRRIATTEGLVTMVAPNKYEVRSIPDDNHACTVWIEDRWLSCNCPDHVDKGNDCIHIHAVEACSMGKHHKLGSVLLPVPHFNIIKCKHCGSTRVRTKYRRKTKRRGRVQVYMCSECNHQFTPVSGFQRAHFDQEIIGNALNTFFTASSYRKTAETIEEENPGITVTHGSIQNWVLRFCTLLYEHGMNLNPVVSERWHVDGMNISGVGYLHVIIDSHTRYCIASVVTEQGNDDRKLEGVIAMFEEAKRVAGKVPTKLVSDSNEDYAIAWERCFSARNREDAKTTYHDPHFHRHDEHFTNNEVEVFFGNHVRQRTRSMREQLNNPRSPILMGLIIHYNLIRKHQGLEGLTPAMAAGINIMGDHKWMNIIDFAVMNRGMETDGSAERLRAILEDMGQKAAEEGWIQYSQLMQDGDGAAA